MPRFYFHLRQDGKLWLDDEVLDLPDQERARREAEAAAVDAVRDRMITGLGIGEDRYEVAEENGNTLFTVGLSDVCEVNEKASPPFDNGVVFTSWTQG